MNGPYDYKKMICELKKELGYNTLTLTDDIQILRREKLSNEDYSPIIKWYFKHHMTMMSYEAECLDSVAQDEEKLRCREIYLNEKPFLQIISVTDCISEMENHG